MSRPWPKNEAAKHTSRPANILRVGNSVDQMVAIVEGEARSETSIHFTRYRKWSVMRPVSEVACHGDTVH